jgi:prevent-host-death family protein
MESDTSLRAEPAPQESEATGEPELPFVSFATTVGIRELASRVSRVVNEVVTSGRPTLVTKHGLPIAMIVAFEPSGASSAPPDVVAADPRG